jgi:xylan 1,4-beta-xylosidase
MRSAHFTIAAGESLGTITALAHAVMGDTAYNALAAGRDVQRKLEAITDRPLLRRTMGTLNTGIGVDHGTGIVHLTPVGEARYDFAFLDQLLDPMVGPRSLPFFGLDFMPLELTSGTKADLKEPWMKLDRFAPADQGRWYDLVHNVVTHCAERYGADTARQWFWDFWNEPDLEFYWLSSIEELLRTYDTTAAAVKDALPGARVGGLGVTDRRAPLLDSFLTHCTTGTNYHTGERGSPLDFITFHAKGGPTGKLGRFGDPWTATDYERRNPSLRLVLDNVRWAMDRISAYPALRGTPVYITECDIDFGVGTSIYHNPNLHYRMSSYFAAFQCALVAQLLDLRREYPHNPIEAACLDTFYFPGQRAFEGQRTLTTGESIDLPILNALRLLGQLGEEQLPSTAAGEAARLIATRARDGSLRVLAVNFDEGFDEGETIEVRATVEQPGADGWRARHYRIDHDHSNAYTAWLKMGRPVPPTDEHLAILHQRMGLEQLEPDFDVKAEDGRLALATALPAHSVSLWVLEPERT